ncbi:hypothetical protein [Cupriavidus metallidurans]|jgi:hypothetical protein|uniref:hypothetical protein n=1 Tax=Cupriavidus metallidurans TaxID=119219 RepID=UPI0007635FA3|nr:hypothetical protein [Cupriavidus metallidurans]KWW34109.1 hypothetical protein AU374_05234 [Cupriavidus metallidurans]
MNTKKQDSRATLLDASLDFIMNSPDEIFEAYLVEAGISGDDAAEKTSRAIEGALQRHQAALKSAALLNGLPVSKQREIAGFLGVPRSVIAAFRERKVIVASIPGPFLRKFAVAIGSGTEALLECLALPPAGQFAHSYKSDAKPNTQVQTTFEQLLIDSQVSSEKLAELMRDQD